MSIRSITKIIFLCIVGALALCAFVILDGVALIQPNANDTRIVFPVPSGIYAVGRRVYDWTDTSRMSGIGSDPKRELMVWVWYPAVHPQDAPNAAYVPGKWGQKAAWWDSLNMRLRGGGVWWTLIHNPVPEDLLRNVRTHAVDGVPISPEPGKFPILLFSPGLGNMPTDYTALIEDIVSHGYIVVGVNPTDFVAATVFPNGQSSSNLHFLLATARHKDELERDFPIWVNDLKFVLDQTQRLNQENEGPFFNRIDFGRVGAFGHSFGGAAAIIACAKDSRVRSCSDLDGTPRGDRSDWNLEKPFFLLQSDHARLDDDRRSIAAYEGSRFAYWCRIKGLRHRGFSDEAFYPLPETERQELIGSLAGTRIVQDTSAYLCAFFDQSLNGSSSPLLKSGSAQFPEVILESKKEN
jgi:hypothetical protein